MKYEISINFKEADALVIQENADAKLRDLYPEPRKNKNAIRGIRAALSVLLPSPDDAFLTKANSAVVVIDDAADDDDDTCQSCHDFLDALVAIAGDFVSVRPL